MKRVLILAVFIFVFLVGCSGSKDYKYEVQTTDAPTITLTKDNTSQFAYQGFVELNILGLENTSKVVLSDIRFEEGKIGTPTLHKGSSIYFSPIDAKNINTELEQGRKYDTIEFEADEVLKENGNSKVKLQYIILGVPTDISKDTIKRNLLADMQIYNENGKIVCSKEIQIITP